jgi:hypothetical protein
MSCYWRLWKGFEVLTAVVWDVMRCSVVYHSPKENNLEAITLTLKNNSTAYIYVYTYTWNLDGNNTGMVYD